MITITDPTRPGEVGDVLVSGDEREPWRPSRWHYRALAYVLALAVAVLVPAQVVSARAEQHRAAVAEAELLALSVATNTDQPGSTTLEVTNDSSETVELLDLAVQAPGYATLRVRRKVAAHTATRVVIPDTRTCERDLVSPTLLGEAVVHLRTASGRSVTRRLDLVDQAWSDLQAAARTRCGWLLPSEAMKVTAGWQWTGRDLVLVVTGRNTGRSELRIGSITDDAGQVYLENPGTRPLLVAPGAPVALRFRASSQECRAERQGDTAVLSVELVPADDPTTSSSLALMVPVTVLDAWLADRCG